METASALWLHTFFTSFINWLPLPTHCRVRGLMLYSITLNDVRVHARTHARTRTHTPHSVGLLWASVRPDAKTSNCKTHNKYKTQRSMPMAGYEPVIVASG
jgi:hypothetical protein